MLPFHLFFFFLANFLCQGILLHTLSTLFFNTLDGLQREMLKMKFHFKNNFYSSLLL